MKSWFAGNKLTLLDKRLVKLNAEIERLAARIRTGEERRAQLQADRDGIKEAISANGGDRIERLALDIRAAGEERDRRRARAERYGHPAEALGLPEPKDADAFARNRGELASLGETLAAREAELQNERTESEVELRRCRQEHGEVTRELDSLRQRRSNIPESQVAIRERLRSSLELPSSDCPSPAN